MRAVIKDQTGRLIATSHKFESKEGFPDFIEKAETGAIGRALALCGFGTQFCADELDEGKRIVDSPTITAASIDKRHGTGSRVGSVNRQRAVPPTCCGKPLKPSYKKPGYHFCESCRKFQAPSGSGGAS